VAQAFEKYIAEQVLSTSISCEKNLETVKSTKFSFENKLEDGDLMVGINL
jgi:hypothetical protein